MVRRKRFLSINMVFYTLFLLIITHAVVSSVKVSHDDIKKFADANNKLTASLYPRLINGNTNNVFFCPASLMTGLGMMLYGARGKTQEELYSVLGYEAAGLPNDKVPPTFHYMFTKQLPEDDLSIVNYTLSCGDEVLVTNRAPLYSTYKEEVKNQYVTNVKNVDFINNANNVAIYINNFVSKQTNGKIQNLVNGVSPGTSSLVIDVVFFKGKWETPFPSRLTSPQPFYSPYGTKYVPLMRVISKFPYTENDEYQAVFLPYVGGNVGLLVILPRQQNGLSTLEKTMTPDMIVNVVNQLKTADADVRIPKFRLQYYRDFSQDFEALGAKSAYDGSADFSGMTSNKDLVVSGPLHKASFEIDEGDQSRNVAFDYIPSASRKLLTADHPFMFAVVDRRDNMLLFCGRIIHF